MCQDISKEGLTKPKVQEEKITEEKPISLTEEQITRFLEDLEKSGLVPGKPEETTKTTDVKSD